jgi:hypothetical protein
MKGDQRWMGVDGRCVESAQLVIRGMASIIGETGLRLSTTALRAAAAGGREAIVDNAARSPKLAAMR